MLNNTMKLELIKFYLTEDLETFLTMCRILFSYSESFYNYSKEAETFYFLFQYLNKSLEVTKNRKKYTIADIRDYFEEFKDSLV